MREPSSPSTARISPRPAGDAAAELSLLFAEIEKLGRKAVVVKADVGEPEGIETLIDETEKAFGGLDILICNAASGYNRPVMEQKIKGWDWTLNINARSVLFLAQKAAPLMHQRLPIASATNRGYRPWLWGSRSRRSRCASASS